jgi:regulator of PEP synthase PpsR (kinase-PPPase family)
LESPDEIPVDSAAAGVDIAKGTNDELEAARRVFKQVGSSVINFTDKPIETSANEVIELITHKLKAESRKK